MRKSLAIATLELAAPLFMPAQATETVPYTVDKTTLSVPESLTGVPGDPKNGRALATDRKKGNCLACHEMPIPEESFHGRIAPPLEGVANRYDAGQMRLRVINPKLVNPVTIMPAFYKSDGLHRVMKEFQGQSILSAQDVEDVVAYLTTLK